MNVMRIFDGYNRQARIWPAFFTFVPIVVLIIAWYPEAMLWSSNAVIVFFIAFGVIAFLASKMSSKGQALQKKLFSKWGGAPTTMALRHCDDYNDEYTTKRYHAWLQENVQGLEMPTEQEEKDKPDDADQRYMSAVNFLKEHTRDTIKFPLVIKENINYGFSRNLLAVKTLGIILALISLLINGALIWFKYLVSVEMGIIKLFATQPVFQMGALLLSLVWLAIWLFSINEEWVKLRAYNYARALLAACDANSQKENKP